jgi:hypothetical protein
MCASYTNELKTNHVQSFFFTSMGLGDTNLVKHLGFMLCSCNCSFLMFYINPTCVVTSCVIVIIIIIQFIYYIVVEALVHVGIEMLIVIIFNITPCKALFKLKWKKWSTSYANTMTHVSISLSKDIVIIFPFCNSKKFKIGGAFSNSYWLGQGARILKWIKTKWQSS